MERFDNGVQSPKSKAQSRRPGLRPWTLDLGLWTLLIAAVLWAVPVCAQEAPRLLPARQLGELLNDSAALMQKLGAASGAEFLAKNRARILQGWAPEVYGALMALRAASASFSFEPGASSAADRARFQEDLDLLDAHFRALLADRERRLRNPDRDNLARYADANLPLGPPAPGERRVVFLGDSITDLWKLAAFFPGKPYVNRGISGQITGEMLGRMKADVLDLKPSAALILAGTNDLARGVALETIENNLEMIGTLARAAGIRVIFASVLPVSDYAKDRPAQTPLRPPEKILALNGWLREYTRRQGFSYLDYHSALKDEKGLLRAELADDGLHPNEAGYKVMAPLAEAAIAGALEKAKGKAQKSKGKGNKG